MKTLCTSIAVALLFSLNPTVLAAADGTPGELIMKVNALEDNRFSLHLANLQRETTYISLEDLYGASYMTKVVKDHNGYRVNVNLDNAPHGRYLLKIRQNGQVYTRVVYYDREHLLFSQLNVE